MIVRAYSLDQIVGVASDTLSGINLDGVRWPGFEKDYFGAKDFFANNNTYITSSNRQIAPKFKHYLEEALSKGLVLELISSPDPFVVRLRTSTGSHLFSHMRWIDLFAYDTGRASILLDTAIKRRIARHTPGWAMRDSDPYLGHREFEVNVYSCCNENQNCALIKASLPQLMSTLEAMR